MRLSQAIHGHRQITHRYQTAYIEPEFANFTEGTPAVVC
jgi:hypothetical protein